MRNASFCQPGYEGKREKHVLIGLEYHSEQTESDVELNFTVSRLISPIVIFIVVGQIARFAARATLRRLLSPAPSASTPVAASRSW